MGVEEGLERVVVLAVDDRVEGLVASTFDLAGRHEAGIDGVTKLRNHDSHLPPGTKGTRGDPDYDQSDADQEAA